MAGLNLHTGAHVNVGGHTGNYAPLTPAAAQAGATAPISNQAFGISGSGANTYNDSVAWVGSVGFGVVALALLVYIWWSLPR